MRYFRIAFIFGLALMIFAGCSKEEIQPDPLSTPDEASFKGKGAKSDPWQTEQNKYVSFEGEFTGIFIDKVIQMPSATQPKIQEVSGSGVVTPFGKMDLHMKQEWTPEVFPPPAWEYLGFGTGIMKFTDEDGDVLCAFYKDAVAEHPYMAPVIITWNARFAGGTGKYANAKGKFQWDGIFTKMGGKATAKGKIKY